MWLIELFRAVEQALGKREIIAGLLLESEHDGSVAITHEEIANTVGVSRVTVSKTLSRFAKAGCISTEYRRILIKSRELLKKIVQGD